MATYNLPNVKPHVVAAANELGTKFGIKTIGGWRKSDPYPDHPSGLALDLMTNNLGSPAVSHPRGTELANYLIANAKRLGVKYIIWNRRSWNTSRGTWANYTGSNPHTDHVHVTFNASPGTGGAPVDGGGMPTIVNYTDNPLERAAGALKDMVGGVKAVGDLAKKVYDFWSLPSTYVRIGAGVFGIGLVVVGLLFLVRAVRS